jgi:hypothetical protein
VTVRRTRAGLQPRRPPADPSPMTRIPTAPAGCSPDSCRAWISA